MVHFVGVEKCKVFLDPVYKHKREIKSKDHVIGIKEYYKGFQYMLQNSYFYYNFLLKRVDLSINKV